MKNKILLFILLTCAIIKSNFLMAQDFRGTHFRNGDLIPNIENYQEWKSAGENKQPAWCYYDYDPANGEKYGKLYNWYAVTDPRGLCPLGWHVPSDAEWSTLISYLGGELAADIKMRNIYGWTENYGDNSSGYAGLPGGVCGSHGSCGHVGYYGYWWSSTEYDSGVSWHRFLYYKNGFGTLSKNVNGNGYSVRCLKD
jgi:uncharacterized protein (TIGR02145 family)